MPKISLHRIRGDAGHSASLLGHLPHKPSHRWSSRLRRLSRRTICLLIVIVILFQSLISYWASYEPAPLQAPPYNVTETVSLITRYYELLREMRYLGPTSIEYPPHVGEKAVNITLARRMGLDEQVIQTMLQMPYINREAEGGGWMGKRDIAYRDGRFVDYRKDRDIFMSRDPLGHWEIYNRQHTSKTFEQDMLDWEDLFPKSAVPLTMVRGGMYAAGEVIVLDTATNHVHVISKQTDGNVDSFFDGKEYRDTTVKIPREYKIFSDFYGPKRQWARHASDFLHDMILKTSALEGDYMPGSPYQNPYTDPELCPPLWFTWIRSLYQKHGWPSPSEITSYIFPSINGTYSNPVTFFKSQAFDAEMEALRNNISVKYLPDWYYPVPRDEEYIAWLEEWNILGTEQATWARGTDKKIPLNLPPFKEKWGRTKLSRLFELYGEGDWDKKIGEDQ